MIKNPLAARALTRLDGRVGMQDAPVLAGLDVNTVFTDAPTLAGLNIQTALQDAPTLAGLDVVTLNPIMDAPLLCGLSTAAVLTDAPMLAGLDVLVLKPSAAFRLPFKGGHGLTYASYSQILDYDIEITLGGRPFDACKLAATLTLTHAENQSATGEMTLRRDCGAINLYDVYGQAIAVRFHGRRTRDYVNWSGDYHHYYLNLFTGAITHSKLNFTGQNQTLSLSDERLRKAAEDARERNGLQDIGFYSQAAFGATDDKPLSVKEELDKRLSTVPAAFQYDNSGNARLVWLLPSYQDSWSMKIDDCSLFKREPVLTLPDIDRVTNSIKLTFTNEFTRLFQRELKYAFDSHYTVCDYGWWGLPPKVDDIKSAISQAGWVLAAFQFTGLEKAGAYTCVGVSQPLLWNPVSYSNVQRTPRTDSSGNTVTDASGNALTDIAGMTVTDYTNMYATTAQWTAAKRWAQSIKETYAITLQNAASIARYGRLEEEMSFGLSNEFDASGFENFNRYAAPTCLTRNGSDYYVNVDSILPGEFERCLKAALNTAYTKILAGHRQNTLEIEMPFAPELEIGAHVYVESKQFKGVAQVAAYTHTIDLINKRAETRLTLKFFQNAEHGDYRVLEPFAQTHKPFAPNPVSGYSLGVTVLPLGSTIGEAEDDIALCVTPEGKMTTTAAPSGSAQWTWGAGPVKADPKKLNGFVTRVSKPSSTTHVGPQAGGYYSERERHEPMAFIVNTPDIEKDNRDSREDKMPDVVIDVPIPNNDCEVNIVCL